MRMEALDRVAPFCMETLGFASATLLVSVRWRESKGQVAALLKAKRVV